LSGRATARWSARQGKNSLVWLSAPRSAITGSGITGGIPESWSAMKGLQSL
jgi:D-hexose-6-phosphate mutarotase